MKIAVVGCGAVGSYYGAMLARAGHEVHFLLRSDYEAVRRDGVRVRSPQGDFQIRVHCARRPEEIGRSDLVLIGLKTPANDQFPHLLPPLAGQQTAVVTLQNGLGNEEQIARLFPPEQILGGLCFVCLNRVAPGTILHLDHGQIVLGEFQGAPGPRTQAISMRLREAGIPCVITDNLARTHWEKLVWNIPFNGLGVAGTAGFESFSKGAPLSRISPSQVTQASSPASGGPPPGAGFAPRSSATLTTDIILADSGWSALLRELMLEVIGAARALGFDLPDSLADKNIHLTRTMGAYKASTLIDFERRLPLELESMFLEPWRRARQAGVSVPRLERLCEILRELDRSVRETGG
jgi:2-dehydropantoate 2-reductase